MDSEIETKAAKLEYLSHSQSAPAHMAATSKWEREEDFLTALKKREHTLFLQHQQALRERLEEEDLKKQDDQRLEEILHMFSEFEKQQLVQKKSENNITEEMKEMKLNTSPTEMNHMTQQSEKCLDNLKLSQAQNNADITNNALSRSYPNRIKTNGSLPQQDQRWTNEVGLYVNHRALEISSSDDDDAFEKTTAASRSPRTRIKTVATMVAAPDTHENSWIEPKKLQEKRPRPSSAVIHIQKHLADLQHQSNETIHELKVEYALVEGEEKEEALHYKEEKLRLEKLQQNEVHLKQELELSKTEELNKLEQARAQLQEGEQLSETGEDQLEGLRKNFEDLEFQYFELQAHNEEQSEHLALQIQQLKETLAQREIRLSELRLLLGTLQTQMEEETSEFHSSQSGLLQALAQAQESAKKMSHSPTSSDSMSFGEKVIPIDLHDSECSSLTSAPEYESNLTDESSLLQQNIENWADTSTVKRRSKSNTLRPLTQFLPSRSSDLDLWQHIEAAGHQASLCSHIHLTETTCRGHLHKLGWLAWRRRWFLFDRERRMLIYFSDRAETRPRGAVSFQAIEEVYVDHGSSIAKRSPNPRATFCVKTSERLFHLAAPTPEAMCIWVDVIFTGAEGYLEFLEEDLES